MHVGALEDVHATTEGETESIKKDKRQGQRISASLEEH